MSSTWHRRILTSLLFLPLAACATHATDRYASDPDNVLALRELTSGKVRVDEFQSSDLQEIGCRMEGTVQPPDGSTYAQYIRSAFVDELKLAGIYSEASDFVLTGFVKDVDFSSVDGSWILGVEIQGPQGASVTADELYEFDTSFIAYSACDQAAQAFMPAVQNLVNTIVTSPDFKEILKGS